MRSEERIKTLAAELGLTMLANPVLSPDEERTYNIILGRSSSPQKVKLLKSSLEREGIQLEIGYYGDTSDPFPSALQESIGRVFAGHIDATTVFKSGGVYQVMVLAANSPPDLHKRLSKHVNEVSRLFDNPPVSLNLQLDVAKPTAIEFLTVARRKAPITCEIMQFELHSRGFPHLSLEWINHQFDRLRKSDLLHRQADRTYVVTRAGLQVLGSGKGRNSPDVIRLLDLARRGT